MERCLWMNGCKRPPVKGKGYCVDHRKRTCHICGKQAAHTCERSEPLYCEIDLCSNPRCYLQHMYKDHPALLSTINDIEKRLGIKPKPILIAKLKSDISYLNGCYKSGFLSQISEETWHWSVIKIDRDLNYILDDLRQSLSTTKRVRDAIIVEDYFDRILTKTDMDKINFVISKSG